MAALGFLDLPGLLAAAFAVVFDHEGDLVPFVERVVRMESCPFPLRRDEAGQERPHARPGNSDVGKGNSPKAKAQPLIVRGALPWSTPASLTWVFSADLQGVRGLCGHNGNWLESAAGVPTN